MYTYSVVMSVTDIIDLATIPSDPALPSGMPSALEYNKVVVSNATNQPLNINEMKIYENQLDNLTNKELTSAEYVDYGCGAELRLNGDTHHLASALKRLEN